MQHVAPNIYTRVSDGISVVLAKYLLWFALRDVQNETYLPQGMTNRIHTEYAALQNYLAARENPIQKILLVVTGNELVTYLDEIGGEMTLAGKEET